MQEQQGLIKKSKKESSQIFRSEWTLWWISCNPLTGIPWARFHPVSTWEETRCPWRLEMTLPPIAESAEAPLYWQGAQSPWQNVQCSGSWTTALYSGLLRMTFQVRLLSSPAFCIRRTRSYLLEWQCSQVCRTDFFKELLFLFWVLSRQA